MPVPVRRINRSGVRDAKDFQGSRGNENKDAPNQVMEKKLPFLEDICKLVPLPTSPKVQGKPEFV